MASFVKQIFRRSHDDDPAYESLPLTSDGSLGAPEPKNVPSSVRIRWLQQATAPKLQWFWAFVPFFIAGPLGKTDRTLPKATSTTYLNGVRGLACWIVFNHHMVMDIYRPWIFKAYGWGKKDHETQYFFQLPIVRILHTGKGMVCLFFALSGFVLSYSSLRKINNGHPERIADELLTGLSSALLRRGIRLFTPMCVLAFITALVSYYIPWGKTDQVAPTLFAHLYRLWQICVKVMNPYSWAANDDVMPRFFPHAWTLAQEYRLSLALFLMVIATCKLTPIARKTVVAVVGVWSMYCARRWDILAFLGGFLIAELRFAPLSKDIGRLIKRPGYQQNRWITIVLAMIALIIGMIFCSWPEFPDFKKALVYKVFWKLAPEPWTQKTSTEPSRSYIWFFGSIGSILMLWGMEQLPLVQRALSCRALNYLGEISYAFYLLHWLFRQTVGMPLFAHLTEKLDWTRTPSFFRTYTLTLGLVIIFSDYFWRAIDVKSVQLARFLVGDVLGVGAKKEKHADPSPPPVQQTTERDAYVEETVPVLRLD